MNIKYLQSGSLSDLEEQVNVYLAAGWKPIGTLLSWNEAPDYRNPTYITWFVQALINGPKE